MVQAAGQTEGSEGSETEQRDVITEAPEGRTPRSHSRGPNGKCRLFVSKLTDEKINKEEVHL